MEIGKQFVSYFEKWCCRFDFATCMLIVCRFRDYTNVKQIKCGLFVDSLGLLYTARLKAHDRCVSVGLLHYDKFDCGLTATRNKRRESAELALYALRSVTRSNTLAFALNEMSPFSSFTSPLININEPERHRTGLKSRF